MTEASKPSPAEISLETPSVSRRNALKKIGSFLGGVVGALAFGSKTVEAIPIAESIEPVTLQSLKTQLEKQSNQQLKSEVKETEKFTGDLSFGLVKGFTDGGNGNEKIIIDRIKDLLENHPVSAVMTAEYAFFPPGDINGFIQLQEKNGKYEVDSVSTPEYGNYLNQLQDLAKKHQTDIFAATFKERSLEEVPIDQYGMPQYQDTMLHIDKNGEIIGIARKGLDTRGDWTIQQNGHTFQTLPLICQDIATETYPNPERPGYPKAKVPASLEGKTYDVLLHPQRLKDVPVEALTDMNQGVDSQTARDYATYKEHIQFMVDNSYSDYFRVLKEGAPIVTTDVNMAGAFTTDGKPFNEYENKKDYSIVQIKR